MMLSSATRSVAPCSVPRNAARRTSVVVKASAINADIRKDEPKVVDVADVSAQDKPQVAYCRCWKSDTFPLCNGAHVAHNKATGDNVGPLLVKK